MSRGLSPVHRDLLAFIHGYQLAHGGISPSVRECGQAIGKPTTQANWLLEDLELEGTIRRLPRRARAIEVLDRPTIPSIGGAPPTHCTDRSPS